MIKRWVIPAPDPSSAAEIMRHTGLPAFVCDVLAARGVDTPEKTDLFLGGEDDGAFGSPWLFADMDKAVARVESAIENGERICVYGDYDCDGVTATALLTPYLQSVGADVFYYIPSREREGYGMNKSAVDTLREMGTDLIVTVDNGVSAHDEIAYAKSLGMDVIVTDHHTPRDTLPDAPVINPHRKDCGSVYKELAGVGVVFKLICALEQTDAEELLEHYSDLVAIGTVADVVALTGENRRIVRHGLSHLPESPRPGIHALMEIAGITGGLSARSIAFGIAPRINAAGRLGEVDEAVELLMTEDAGYAPELAQHLDELNRRRREIEDKILAEIELKIGCNPQLLFRRVLLLSGYGWHHGVIGIVAARLMERYGKPVILFAVEGGEARGSGRGIEGFSLIEAIDACSERLTRYGGHKMAAGLTLPVDELEWFGHTLEAFCAGRYPVMPVQTVPVDCIVEPESLTIERVRSLDSLEPFGAENPSPQFALLGMTVGAILPTQDGKHLRLRLTKGMNEVTAVYFGMNASRFPYAVGDAADIVVQADIGEYRGAVQLSLFIREMRPAGLEADDVLEDHERYLRHRRGEYGDFCRREDLLFDRDTLALVYRFLLRRGRAPATPELLCRWAGERISFARLCVILDVLEELELAERVGDGVRIYPDPPRADLTKSRILADLAAIPLHTGS